eukprot:TRINITY_DN1256_c0_g1_i10.p1 TRINITY_DN1256_c0_g1~~TRINITY_DN1256_c0_g1_i10.p1  ORF type:complete len:485 (+),score=-51.64 TRINITY_DN1256_c0_g1_i10:1024-2478(+)
MTDVLIIGGGVIGCSVARELARYNLKLILLEKTEDISNGQSKANTGIVHGGYDAKPGTLKAKFNVLGNKMFKDVVKELGVPYKNNGSLVVSFENGGREMLESLLNQGIENGVEGLKIIGKEELLKKEPGLNKSACEALFVPTGGIVSPYELTIAYAENAAENGVEFFRNKEVTNIKKEEDNTFSVYCGDKIFKTKCIVNAAGIYSGKINNMISKNKIEIIARRGEYYLLNKTHENDFNCAIFQLPTKMGKGTLIAKTVEGTVLIGPTAEDIKDKDDTRTTSEGLKKALKFAKLTKEEIPLRDVITTFSGIRSHSTNGDFIIGECDDVSLFFNASGIESPGLTSAPAISSYLAKQIAKKLDATQNKNFNPNRKPLTKFANLSNEERAKVIACNPDYAKIVCRCEKVSEAEIRQCIKRPVGARSLDGIKRRTRAGMGECQAGFCTNRLVEILCEELNISPFGVTKQGGKSNILESEVFGKEAVKNA